MRLEVELFAAEPRPQPPKTANHLVADDIQIVFGAHRHDLREIGPRRHDDAARAHYRLGNERSDRIRPFLDNQCVKFGGEPGGEVFLGLAVFGEAVIMRTAGVQKAAQRNVEIAMIAFKAGQRGGRDGNAVIGLQPADDFLFERKPAGIVEIPDELDLGVVCFRAGIAKEHLRDRYRCDLLELLGKFDARIVALAGEQMRERKLAHLCRCGLDQLLIAVAERRAPETGHAFEITLALGVIDINAFAALDHHRAVVAKRREIGVRMHQRFDVAGGKIAQRSHENPFGNPSSYSSSLAALLRR